MNWFQTWLDSWIFEKQLKVFFILKYLYKCIRTPASIRTVSHNSSTIFKTEEEKKLIETFKLDYWKN